MTCECLLHNSVVITTTVVITVSRWRLSVTCESLLHNSVAVTTTVVLSLKCTGPSGSCNLWMLVCTWFINNDDDDNNSSNNSQLQEALCDR